MVIRCNSSDGGKISAKAGVKLAYKTVFALIFASDGYPMLLDRYFGQEDEPSELQHMRRKKKGDGHESEKSDRHKEYTGSHPGG